MFKTRVYRVSHLGLTYIYMQFKCTSSKDYNIQYFDCIRSSSINGTDRVYSYIFYWKFVHLLSGTIIFFLKFTSPPHGTYRYMYLNIYNYCDPCSIYLQQFRRSCLRPQRRYIYARIDNIDAHLLQHFSPVDNHNIACWG